MVDAIFIVVLFVKDHKHFIQSPLLRLVRVHICPYPNMKLQTCSSCDNNKLWLLYYCTSMLLHFLSTSSTQKSLHGQMAITLHVCCDKVSARNCLAATSREGEGDDVKRREKIVCLLVRIFKTKMFVLFA